MKGFDVKRLDVISVKLEETVDYMTDCREPLAVNKLMDYPVIRKLWLYQPARSKWVGRIFMCLFPIGFPSISSASTLSATLRKSSSA